MNACITSGTPVFLLNLQTLKLMGQFTATGAPDRCIASGAFGGKFNAHVRVAASKGKLREVKLERRIPTGRKTVAEVGALEQQLQQGQELDATSQQAWDA